MNAVRMVQMAAQRDHDPFFTRVSIRSGPAVCDKNCTSFDRFWSCLGGQSWSQSDSVPGRWPPDCISRYVVQAGQPWTMSPLSPKTRANCWVTCVSQLRQRAPAVDDSIGRQFWCGEFMGGWWVWERFIAFQPRGVDPNKGLRLFTLVGRSALEKCTVSRRIAPLFGYPGRSVRNCCRSASNRIWIGWTGFGGNRRCIQVSRWSKGLISISKPRVSRRNA